MTELEHAERVHQSRWNKINALYDEKCRECAEQQRQVERLAIQLGRCAERAQEWRYRYRLVMSAMLNNRDARFRELERRYLALREQKGGK